MHKLAVWALLFAMLIIVTQQPIKAQEPILNVFLHALPAQVVRVEEQIAFQADIYSTSDTIEIVHLDGRTDPLQQFEVVSVLQPNGLGSVECANTLLYVSCDVAIQRFHPIYVSVVLDAPLLVGCKPPITFKFRATLPNRDTYQETYVDIDNGELCTYLPFIYNTPGTDHF